MENAKLENIIFFFMFIIIWLVIIFINFIMPNKAFSEQENRMLAKIPTFNIESLVNGEYAEKLNDYINDHFVFRDKWLKIKSFMEIATGKQENNGVYIGKNGYLFEKFEFTSNDKENLKKAADAINNFADRVKVPTYFMLIPNSIYINREYLPENVEIYSQNEIIKEMYRLCNTNNIDVVEILESNKEQYIYYKTDHHTTSFGAYLLYVKYCESLNISPIKLNELQKEIVSEEFLGTFDSKAQIYNQEKDTIFIYKNNNNTNLKEVIYDKETTKSIYNSEYLNGKDKYSYFLNGNNAKVVIRTNINNGKKLLLIKDSYAHNMPQFLSQNYEEIHFIDPRYYKKAISEYVVENNITEILFLYNVSNIKNDVHIRTIK